MAEEDYELMPHNEISELRKELKELKKGSSPGIKLQILIERLNSNIEDMLELIRDASKDVNGDSGSLAQNVAVIKRDVAELKSQNEKIAQAILAVADMVKKPAGLARKEGSPFDAGPPGFGPGPMPLPRANMNAGGNINAGPVGGPPLRQQPMPPPAGMPPPPGLGALPKKKGWFHK